MATSLTGKLLGRPPGSRNKVARKLDVYKDQVEKYLKMGLSISAVRKIINSQLEKALSYSAYVFFINRDGELAGIISKNQGISSFVYKALTNNIFLFVGNLKKADKCGGGGMVKEVHL